jgi:superfamily II DNA or RNA helicase
MDYSRILQFKGTWRSYQARVLENTEKYIEDGKIHIVAAPGSGKTTLGIELIARMKEAALVLTPSITIRQQWAARIAEGFLLDGLDPADYISQNLKEPRCITIATYQALHSAMSHYKGVIDESGTTVDSLESDDKIAKKAADCGTADLEEVDYSRFDVLSEMKNAGIGVLCLDECHHLRSEWWKALEEFKNGLGTPKLIALTATPPYDSTPAMWKRYMDMCGEIDEEITVPELVREGSLCPHQDFVYFNYPTEEELAEVERFTARSSAMQQKLWNDVDFLAAVKTHGALDGSIAEEELSDKAEYLSALLSFLHAKNEVIPEQLWKKAAKNGIPSMSIASMEMLLQGFLYEDADSYRCEEKYRGALETELKASGLIEKKKVVLQASESIEKMLISSKGKCKSIEAIVRGEYESMGKDLRMLILTDYIRKEYERAIGNEESDVTALGVLPFFEQLRRAAAQTGRQTETANMASAGAQAGAQTTMQTGNAGQPELTGLRLGVLCGTIVIIPAEAKEALLDAIGDRGRVNFSSVGSLPEGDYIKVTAVGDNHFLTQAVTDIFAQGSIQVLVGTKSLLGEGWDSPCINSLILASFVGAYMLSNQMRGRAIRVFPSVPDKTSNIWHLICLMPAGILGQLQYAEPERASDSDDALGQDYAMLARRMENFLGLHYEQDIIENGMERLSIIGAPFDKDHVDEMNAQMVALSKRRDELKERWDRSLNQAKKMEVVDETSVEEESITKTEADRSKRELGLAGLGAAAGIALAFTPLGWLGGAAAVGCGLYGASRLPKFLKTKTPQDRLKAIGEGICLALQKQKLLDSPDGIVRAEEGKHGRQSIYLDGGSGKDRLLFAQCVSEFFSAINSQRYLLVKTGRHDGDDGFYCVPECFGKRKEDAELFYSYVRPYIGRYDLVYTRNAAGKQMLLEGRMKSLAQKRAASSTRKCVKTAGR